jgi:hypothetical protein
MSAEMTPDEKIAKLRKWYLDEVAAGNMRSVEEIEALRENERLTERIEELESALRYILDVADRLGLETVGDFVRAALGGKT